MDIWNIMVDKWTDSRWTDSLLVLKDFFPFGTTAQKGKEKEEGGESENLDLSKPSKRKWQLTLKMALGLLIGCCVKMKH